MEKSIIEALIYIHEGLPRKGPGSDALTLDILQRFADQIPAGSIVADMGCGNGHSAFLLAEQLKSEVIAIDFSAVFINELKHRLKDHPASITPIVADMSQSGMDAERCHLIWSEGAAYAVGVEKALKSWHPLLTSKGLLIFSECCWLSENPSSEALNFWRENHPEMRLINGHIALAETLGYHYLDSEVLPSEAWWQSYYDPLIERLAQLQPTVKKGSSLEQVISATKKEYELFRRYKDQYGYVFFILQKDR
ncbi:class I SAM-dependent methyltransferase [Magnetococcales bacterium HHB-1]